MTAGRTGPTGILNEMKPGGERNAAALARLDHRTPDPAMLDRLLSDGFTVELARML